MDHLLHSHERTDSGMDKRRIPFHSKAKIFSLTHQGLVRANNEDRFMVREYDNGRILLAVADGMGGHAAGERAAETALDTLALFEPGSQPVEDALLAVVLKADRSIHAASSRESALRGMGTTLTAAFIEGATLHWIHVGDSRLYIFRKGKLIQVTIDHTIPGLMVKRGEIDSESARIHPMKNMLLRCMGCDEPRPDQGSIEIKDGDVIMLSTDGLHDCVPESEIAAVLETEAGLEEKVKALVSAALASGGPDNITLVAARM